MAVITSRGFVRHLQAGPTAHVRRLRRGEVVSSGTGASFWFRPIGAAISEVPTEELERSVMFKARTSDHQDVSVQATLSFRIADPDLAAARLDFSLDLARGHWNRAPLEALSATLTEMAQQHAVGVLASLSLRDVMERGIGAVRDVIEQGMAGERWLAETGIGPVTARVIAVRPEADLEKALQNPIREQLQQEADKATFERRALAVQQERAISENELSNRIELARQEEELVAQVGANATSEATLQAETSRITSEAKARDVEIGARATATRTRLVGEAAGAAERAKLDAFAGVSDSTLMALAVRDAASNLPEIDTLVLTPEMITPLLARFVAAASPELEA